MSITLAYRARSQYLQRIRQWLESPLQPDEFWLGRYCALVAWLGLLIAAVSPPHGFGVPLCFFQSSTGIPCPGCGLTRSLSCGIRGMFLESLSFHPMGLMILVLFVFTALQSLLPGYLRLRLLQYMKARSAFFNTLYVAFVCAFVTFGATRALVHLSHLWVHLH